jgi:FdhE protein
MSALRSLQDLERQKPEWQPWLAAVGVALGEIEESAWIAFVPDVPSRSDTRSPLLSEARLRLDPMVVERLVARLQPKPNGISNGVGSLEPAALAIFRHAINGDQNRLRQLGTALGVEPDEFAARAALVPMPFLHACRARWEQSIPQGWSEGYCPLCGACPAFAEVRGVERVRYLRCGRCGSAWQTSHLRCPYCTATDHNMLRSLVVEGSMPPSTIEACEQCRGYVKVFSMLQGHPASAVMLQDLASAELDFSAAQRGYQRPGGLGHALGVTLTT